MTELKHLLQDIYLLLSITGTGIDLSKILEGKPKFFGEQNVVKTDKCMCVSKILGACTWAAPKVYAYDNNVRLKQLLKDNSTISNTVESSHTSALPTLSFPTL